MAYRRLPPTNGNGEKELDPSQAILKALFEAEEKRKRNPPQPPPPKPLPDLTPKPYLVAYIDILGFGRAIENAKTKEDLEAAYKKVRKVQDEFQHALAADNPDERNENNAAYGRRVLALSDAVVIAITPNCPMLPEMGGYDVVGLGIFELIVAQARCACQGIFVRGGVSHGPFFFEDDVLLSPALARAYELESKYAEFPLIVVPESTRKAILGVPRKGSYAPGADPTPPYFEKYGNRKWRNEQLYFLNYVRTMLNEDHRGWIRKDFEDYKKARKERDHEKAQRILNRRAMRDAAYFLKWHRRKLETAYRATSSERVRKKYRWLMDYHNRSFRRNLPFLRQQTIDMRKFRPKNTLK